MADKMESPTKLKINAKDLQTLTCEACQGQVFGEGLIIKTVSPLLTENGKEGMMPIPAFYCIECHTVVEKYLPEDMKKPKISI